MYVMCHVLVCNSLSLLNIYWCDHSPVQLAAKVSALQQQIVDTERQKQMVHEYLYSNNEAVTRVQKEVKTATASMYR